MRTIVDALKKEGLTSEIEIGDLVQDECIGDHYIVGFKNWVGNTRKGYFIFNFNSNDIFGIYDSIEEMVEKRELRLIAKNNKLQLLYLD